MGLKNLAVSKSYEVTGVTFYAVTGRGLTPDSALQTTRRIVSTFFDARPDEIEITADAIHRLDGGAHALVMCGTRIDGSLWWLTGILGPTVEPPTNCEILAKTLGENLLLRDILLEGA